MLELLGILFIFYWVCGFFDNTPTDKKKDYRVSKKDESSNIDDPSFQKPYRKFFRNR